MITLNNGRVVGVTYSNSGTDAMENLRADFEIQNVLDLCSKVGNTHVKMLKEAVAETPKKIEFGLKNKLVTNRGDKVYTQYIINGVAHEGIVAFCPIFRISGDITITVEEPVEKTVEKTVEEPVEEPVEKTVSKKTASKKTVSTGDAQ